LRELGIPVTVFPVNSFGGPQLPKALIGLARYINRHNIALVHSFDTPMNLAGTLAARMARAPAVLSSQRAHRGLAPFPYRHLLRLTDQWVDGVVVNCRAVERHLVEDERVPRARLRLCYNGVDTDSFHRAAGPRPEALPAGEFTIGVVCAMRPEKELDMLLGAFARFRRREGPALRLVLVGDGPMREPLRRQAAELGIDGQCLFQPTTADVAPWLAALDVFVLPSRSEALSNSLMEAMACGCCVLASRVGGNSELVEDEVTGLLFDSGDVDGLAARLHRVVADPPLRHRLAANAVERMRERFSIRASVARMQEIYAEALGQEPGA
jgi:glycosyltransferase involved in cell wall biosynthesis